MTKPQGSNPFLFGCVPARFFLAYTIANSNPQNLPFLKLILCSISIGFAVIYLFDLRKTGPEVFGGSIWWNHLRPIHSLMYGLATYLLFNGQPNSAATMIMIDTFLGLKAHVHHYNY